jgi:MutS domain V
VLDPRAEYSRRLEVHLGVTAGLERRHIRVGNLKLATLAAGVVLAIFIVARRVSPYWILAPGALFLALAIAHEGILRAKSRAEAATGLYRRGIARIEDNWPGTGSSGDRFRDRNHVYADDLDLFGRGCLFELLSTARLPMGEERLASWLLAASPTREIIERQGIVAELRENLDLREDIALTGEDLRPRLEPAPLLAWAEGTPQCRSKSLRVIFPFLALAALATIAYLFAEQRIFPLASVLAVELLLYSRWRQRAQKVMETLHSNAEGLALFSQVLERIEREQFRSPHLRGRTAELAHAEVPASRAVHELARIVYWVDGRDGMLAKLADLPLLYSLQTAFAADAWRGRWGPRMRSWLAAAGEVEALLSLASYSFEHPADPFPEFARPVADSGYPPSSNGSRAPQAAPDESLATPIFDGQELGHPLIPSAQCVPNSIRLDAGTRVLLVSGSNMSGKSTLLRTTGINLVLALAGAPIRGKSLRLTPVALGTRIRSTDSLQEGRSNFYTEILHIRRVFDLLGARTPLLFLFDELLEGTNSKDRYLGADGLLRALLGRGAIGMVTTHDLALTRVAESLGPLIRNVHFQDYVEDGNMRFDYKLRDGVVAKSNAIELMRLIGLRI